jgi:hypothetical protein
LRELSSNDCCKKATVKNPLRYYTPRGLQREAIM